MCFTLSEEGTFHVPDGRRETLVWRTTSATFLCAEAHVEATFYLLYLSCESNLVWLSAAAAVPSDVFAASFYDARFACVT